MSNILDLDGADRVEQARVSAGDDNFLDGAGDSTSTYNDTSGDDDTGVTFVQTDLGRVDEVIVTVQEDDADAATGTTIARGSPATEAVTDDLDNFPEGDEPTSFLLELYDAGDGSEITGGTDVSDLVLTYIAVRTAQ